MRIFPSGFLANLQTGLLLGVVLLFVSPFALPDPLGLGAQLSWAVVCLGGAALICVPEVLSGRWPTTRLDGILAAYLAFVALSAWRSVDHWETLKASVLLASQIGMFYATVAGARRAPWLAAQIMIVLIVGAAVVEVMALGYHVEFGLAGRPKVYPIPEGWGGYPELGSLAVLQFGALAGALLTAGRSAEWISLSVVTLIAVVETVLLYSRTAWSAAAAIGVLSVPLAARYRKALLLAGGAAVIVVTLVALASPTVRFLARNAMTGSTDTLIGGPRIDIASPSDRLRLWTKTIRMIADHPLGGVGPGNFRSVFEAQYNPELNTDDRRGVHAHNLWLHQTAELGIPGGICFLLLWGGVLWMAWRSAITHRSAAALGVFLAIVGATVSNLTDSVPAEVSGTRIFLLTWVLFGLAAAAGQNMERTAEVEKAGLAGTGH